LFLNYNIFFLEKCRLNIKQCRKCKNFHYYSYATDESKSVKKFYKNAPDDEYFHVTNETLITTALLKKFLADVLFGQMAFSSFCRSYNYSYAAGKKRFELKSKRLSDLFFGYELLKFYSEHELGELESK
jgi:hypothetical protein